MMTKLRILLFKFFRIDEILIEVVRLKKENDDLKMKVDEHERAIASMAILQVRMIKDLLMISNLQASNSKLKFSIKKVDDDMLN